MPLKVGIGFSQKINGAAAAQEAAEQAKRQLNHDRIDFALIYSTSHYNPDEFLPLVYGILDRTRVIGSSTAGIIVSDHIALRGIGILAMASEKTRFETTHVSHLPLQDISAAGETLIKNCLTDFSENYRKLFLFFVDGILTNTSSLVEGMRKQLGPVLPIIGVGSSDDFHFYKTSQYHQDKALSQGVVGTIVGGHAAMGISCRHGWKPLGKPRTISKMAGPIIQTINDGKASHIYEEYFGNEAASLKTGKLEQINLRYPLGFRTHMKSARYFLRTALKVLDDGGIVCQDTVPEGTQAHIMIGSKDFCIQAAEEAARDVKGQLAGKIPAVVLIFESLTRYKILGRSAVQEIAAIKKILGDIPVFGMYSAHETFTFRESPEDVQTILQNNSIVIVALT